MRTSETQGSEDHQPSVSAKAFFQFLYQMKTRVKAVRELIWLVRRLKLSHTGRAGDRPYVEPSKWSVWFNHMLTGNNTNLYTPGCVYSNRY